MPRKKSGEFNQNEYVKKYIHDTYKWVTISFNVNKPEDMKMHEYLKQFNKKKTEYIKGLIRKDMEKGGE